MITIYKDKITELQFSLNIEGNTNIPEARLLIPIKEGVSILFGCSVNILENKASVLIPPIDSIIKEKVIDETKDLILEVEVDNQIFRPFKDKANIRESMKIDVNLTETKEKEKDIKIKITSEPMLKGHSLEEDDITKYVYKPSKKK